MTGPAFIRFGRAVCGDLNQAERREWWLANGLGAYAAGTIAGSLTRRYHGLLIAPIVPPLGRYLVLAKADAWLNAGDHTWPLFSNRWPDNVINPQGHIHLESFHLDGRMPVWQFAFGDLQLTQRIWLEPGANTVYVAYKPTFLSAHYPPLALTIRILVNARDHHGNVEPWRFNPLIEANGPDGLYVSNPPDSSYPPYHLQLQARGGVFKPMQQWIEHFDMPVERERGLPFRDRHLCVAELSMPLCNNEWSGFSASLEQRSPPYIEEAMRRFFAYDDGLLTRAQVNVPALHDSPDWINQLLLTADNFLIKRPVAGYQQGETVIAGYPWFGDWGRDTMIALPGLTLATGRYDSARHILGAFAEFIDHGMLPNHFPGNGEQPEYNTVDAALWYIEAWRAYTETTGDWQSLQAVFPKLEEIIRYYRDGTRHGIALDTQDGLLRSGEAGVQLTWMDAKIGAWVVTPRTGKAVEINALWYNALRAMAGFAEQLGNTAVEYEQLADSAQKGFSRFVNPQSGGLYDVLDTGDDGGSIRPNQILAVSLPFSPLPETVQRDVVRLCAKQLLTSYGLRSLAPDAQAYQSRYRGGVPERDGAYHQGTVWTWLLGHYALAEYRVTGNIDLALSRLQPIREHLFDAGLGTVSEIYDAEPPHTPGGAPSQAWSVACVLEAWWRLKRAQQNTTGSIPHSACTRAGDANLRRTT